MSTPSAGITFTTIQEMMPQYNLPPDLLEDVVAAMPPPPEDATEDWRHARLDRMVEEIASRVPMNAAQASLAGQVIIAQRLADAMATRTGAPGLETGEMIRLGRLTDALLHTVTRLERTLERRQFRVMPFRDVRPVDGADLMAMDRAWGRRTTGGAEGEAVRGRAAAAMPPAVTMAGGRAEMVVLDGVWCDRATGEPAVLPRGPKAAEGEPAAVRRGPDGGLREAEAASLRRRQAAAEGVAAKEGVGAGRLASAAAGDASPRAGQGPDPKAGMTKEGPETGTGSEQRRSREGVTIERGEGWSMEVWPAVAGANAGSGGAGLAKAGARRGPGDRA